MGDRKCQFADCRSLAFRSTDYCWKHQEGKPHEKNPGIPITSENSNAEASEVDWVTALSWVFLVVFLSVFLFWGFVIMPAYGS